MDTRPLEGQVSLVTGASRGIGRATALALCDAGSAVVLAARTVPQLDEVAAAVSEQGGRALVAELDVTDPASVRRVVADAVDAFGQIDVLVNNAGSNSGDDNGAVGPFAEINPDAWWWDVEVNFRGAFLCTHAVLPHMLDHGRGHVVNVTSLAAVGPWPHDSAYACAKAAVMRLTDSIAAEVRDRGVFLFGLSPGSVDTKLRAGAVDSAAGRRWLTQVNTTPQWVPAEVPAAATVFLASGQADGLTGRIVHATWDLPEIARRSGEVVERDILQLRFTEL